MIHDIESNLALDQVVQATRKSWNKEQLEYWVELSLLQQSNMFVAPSILGNKTVLYSEGFCKLKDGTPVADAFKLADEDYEADDWVII